MNRDFVVKMQWFLIIDGFSAYWAQMPLCLCHLEIEAILGKPGFTEFSGSVVPVFSLRRGHLVSGIKLNWLLCSFGDQRWRGRHKRWVEELRWEY